MEIQTNVLERRKTLIFTNHKTLSSYNIAERTFLSIVTYKIGQVCYRSISRQNKKSWNQTAETI